MSKLNEMIAIQKQVIKGLLEDREKVKETLEGARISSKLAVESAYLEGLQDAAEEERKNV